MHVYQSPTDKIKGDEESEIQSQSDTSDAFKTKADARCELQPLLQTAYLGTKS